MEIITKILKGPIDNVLNKLEQETKQIIYNRLLEYQVEEYNRNCHTKTILHRTEPIKLSDFYQPLFIRPYGKKYVNDRISTNSAKLLFSRSRFVTLLGTAGSGKSTIVKHLIVTSIEEEFLIPIKVELRYLNGYGGSLYNYIIEEIFKFSKLGFDDKIINRLLLSGDFLFFFDGYDELNSEKKEKITKDINEFTKVYSKNCFLLTSRPYTNIELLTKFSNFEVCELTESEIKQFVIKQIPKNEHEIAEKIIDAIIKEKNGSYQTFLSIPLLLSMFILTFQTYSNVPPKKSAFYKQVFDSLYYLHDSMSKLAYTREKNSGLNKEQFEELLKVFSFISFFKQVFVFSEEYLVTTLNQIKDKKKHLIFENNLLIEDLQVAICIMQKEGVDYSFPHRSLQEYFATLYISNLDQNNKHEVYTKILEQFKNSEFNELIAKDNFFSLLIEQDYYGIVKNLSIPFIEYILTSFKGETQTKEEINSLLGSLQFYLIAFHHEDAVFQPIANSFREYTLLRHEVINTARQRHKETNKILFTKAEAEKIDSAVNDLTKHVKATMPKILRILKDNLKELNNSDSNIIELI